MIFQRTPVATGLPVSLTDAKDVLRITHLDEDALIDNLIRVAALEVEAQTDLALLTTTITATTDDCPGSIIALPVGPVASGAVATVHLVELDGSLTAVTEGFWLEGGRYPRLHFTTTPGGTLRVVYTAGYGADAGSVPRDLGLAITDQVVRYYEQRGGIDDKGPALSSHTARVIARYRKVSL